MADIKELTCMFTMKLCIEEIYLEYLQQNIQSPLVRDGIGGAMEAVHGAISKIILSYDVDQIDKIQDNVYMRRDRLIQACIHAWSQSRGIPGGRHD